MKDLSEVWVRNYRAQDRTIQHALSFYRECFDLPDQPEVVFTFLSFRTMEFADQLHGLTAEERSRAQENTDHFLHACVGWVLFTPEEAIGCYRKHAALVERVITESNLSQPARGIVYGCAAAAEIIELLSTLGNRVERVDGTDSPKVSILWNRYAQRHQLASRGWIEAPRGDYHFGVCMNTLEHMVDPIPYIDRALKSLVPGGLFIANVDVTKDSENNCLHYWKADSYREILLPRLAEYYQDRIKFLDEDRIYFMIQR